MENPETRIGGPAIGSPLPFALLALAAVLLVAACSLPPVANLGADAAGVSSRAEIGTASWYGPGFHGNRTSSGEIYDQRLMTAAHQRLPLGTRVMVTNLQNAKSVELRVNDRGPYVGGRLIDLSYAAARALDLVGPGTARVRVEPLVNEDEPGGTVQYAVQAGAFASADKAVALRQALSRRRPDVYMSPVRGTDSLYYRVRVGPFPSRREAVAQQRQLVRRGLPAMVTHEDVQ